MALPSTTFVFIASNTREEDITVFSNVGSALDFVRDSHADLNPEGSALMLDGDASAGLVPASNKAVKDSYSNVLRFSAAGADAASNVARVASLLDGAIQACVGLGIDPGNVGKIDELADELATAQANVGTESDSVAFTIERVVVHKRTYKK